LSFKKRGQSGAEFEIVSRPFPIKSTPAPFDELEKGNSQIEFIKSTARLSRAQIHFFPFVRREPERN